MRRYKHRRLKRAWAGFLTVITSSVVVRTEKNLTVTIVTGVLLSLGAADGLINLITVLVKGL